LHIPVNKFVSMNMQYFSSKSHSKILDPLNIWNGHSKFQACTIFVQYNFCTGGLLDLSLRLTAAPPNTYSFGFFEKTKKTHTAYHNDTFLK